jgi:hypothetical protein
LIKSTIKLNSISELYFPVADAMGIETIGLRGNMQASRVWKGESLVRAKIISLLSFCGKVGFLLW